MMPSYPLISCICTTDNRPDLLQKAINCFKSQNYLNKELVISFPKKDGSSRKVIAEDQNSMLNILCVEREENSSLEDAKSQAIKKSTGEYICTWDDSDWHHPSRISYQYNSIQNKGEGYQASVLSRILLYDATQNKAYSSLNDSWEGTLLCRKTILTQHQYNNDTVKNSSVIELLQSKKQLLLLDQAPFLYIYIHYGTAIWKHQNLEFLMSQSQHLKEEEKENMLQYMN